MALISLAFMVGMAVSQVEAQAISFPGQTAVGTPGPSLVATVAIQKSGKVSAVNVVGQGNAGVDFAGTNSGTCAVGISYPAGQTCTVGVSFAPLYPGVRSGAVVLTAQDGTVLGTEYLSGVGVGGVGTFVPGMMSTVAGQATWLYNGDGIPATSAAIFLPYGVALDSAGNMYIADSGNNRVRKVKATTGTISTIAGDGTLGDTGDGGSALQATLSGPSSVAIDGAGNLYVCDTGNNVVRKIVPSTGMIATAAGTMSTSGYTGDGSLATAATLNSPNGISVDSSGNLFIADTANSVIRRVDAVTGIITTFAGIGRAGFSGDGGAATSARLNEPWSITPGAGGVLYIADQGNNRIRMVDTTGVISTIAGTGSSDFSGDAGPALQAQLDAPASVAVDVAGNIYVADSGNNRVRKITYGTNEINTIAGLNSQSISGDGGPANNAGLYGPYTLALDGIGNLYIADVFHNRIREVAANTAILDFQPMRIGRVATAQQQTLENDGNAAMNLTSVQAVTDSVVDGPTTTCLNAMSLPPLGTCIVGAAFAPTALGTPDVGSISVTSDAANSPGTLKLSGNVLSEDPSTVTLVSSANPVNIGSTVFFTVTASSDGAVPTGQVTLLDGANAIGTATLQTGGVATFNVSTLTGGQHSMTASYAGDTNNTSGVSAALIEVVKDLQAPTTTTVSASANPVLAGASLTLSATVAVVSAGSGNGTISGSVTFTDGSTIIGAGSVANGVATATLSTLAVGQHSIIATFSGTSSFATSASTALALTVEAGTTTTTVSSGSNPSFAGGKLVLTGTVVSNGAMPTGTVTFLDGTTPLGSSLVNKAGVATLSVTGLAIGSHSIVAIYGGDLLNNGSSSNALTQTVSIATTKSVVTSSLNPAPQGSPVILKATITSNGGIPTGTVQFFDGTITLGNGTLDATGAATLTTATLGVGAHNITAAYQGDTLDGVSTSMVLVQTIVTATTTVSFVASANPSPAGGALTFSVQVQGTGAQPSGSIALQDAGTSLGTQPLDPTGLATFPGANLAIGIHSLVALYSGDADHAQNSASLSERIVQVTTTSLVSSTLTGIAGTNVTWTATVTGVSNQPLTGTVVFKDGANAIATVAVGAAGVATYSSSSMSIGQHTLSAVYSGDTLDQASSSVAIAQTIQIATTNTTLVSSSNPAFAGANLTLTATVSGNGAAPTGSITIRDGGTTLGTLPVSATGSVSFSTATLTPGIHTLTASYSGDGNDSASSAVALTQSIVQQTVLTVYSSANPSMYQDNVSITVTVSGGLAAYPPTGSVTLSDGTAVVGTGTIDALGNAYFTLTAPSLGQHVLSASYTGDTHNSPATSPNLSQNVILRPTTNGFTTSSNSLSAGQQVTFISLVQGTGPKFPTGIVTFVSGSTILGTAPLNANGLATFNFTPALGSYNVVAQYPGDTLFAASNSTATSVIVGPTVEFTMNVTPSTVSMASGDHTTLSINIVTAPTFTDTLAIGCAGLPPSATCTFSTNDIKVVGGGTASLTMVLDTGNPLGAGATASLAERAPSTALACMLPGGALLALLFCRTRRFRKQLSALAMLLVLFTVGMLSGCGNSLNVKDTPPGSYTILVIGTGATSGVTQSGTIALTVTQ